jgi:hypothetical protein
VGAVVRGRVLGLSAVTAAVVVGVVPLAALAGLALVAGVLGACELGGRGGVVAPGCASQERRTAYSPFYRADSAWYSRSARLPR